MLIAKISCPACGVMVENGATPTAGNPLVCPTCGIAFALPGPQPSGPVTASSDQSLVPPRESSLRSRPKKSHIGTIWVITALSAVIVLLTVAGAGGLVYYFAFLKNPAKQNASHSADSDEKETGQADPPFDTWIQDLAKAKERAAHENKDILLLFNASDSSTLCQAMADNVFSKAAFKNAIEEQYVPLYLDFPQKPSNLGKVADSEQNAALKREYRVLEFPMLFLADAEGQPYMHGGFSPESAEAFAARLVKLKKLHAQRDKLFKQAKEAEGPAKLKAGAEALSFLAERDLASHYKRQVQEWGAGVNQEDPKNEQGIAEVFFEADWLLDMSPRSDLAQMAQRLDDWKKGNSFKDKNRAARMHYWAGRLAAQAGQRDLAMRYALDGLGYRPDNSRTHQDLFSLAGEMGLTCGSGFVVAPGGYILTNAHVVSGGGRISVRQENRAQTVPARVLAEDVERDIAVLKVENQTGLTWTAVPVDGKRALERGEDVAALGFPLGDLFGTGIKLTTGRVTSTPDPINNNMIVIENKINPGNSGGPICDTHGNVVGMVTAKTNNRNNTDSYGLALTGADLDKFLRNHLKDYKPAVSDSKTLTWPEVNRKISPSVVMIFRTPG
jgi:S1-C subfamily serine protease/thioredoxin-related protein